MLLKIEKFKWLENPFLSIVLGLPRKSTYRLHNKAPSPNKADDFRIAANLADKDDEKPHQALLLSQLNLWGEHQPVLRFPPSLTQALSIAVFCALPPSSRET